MFHRNGKNDHSNDELARQLFRREARKPAPASEADKTPAEPLASRKEPFAAGNQSWSLGKIETNDQPVNERERSALFAALSKGTKANLGREPTVAELMYLVEQIDKARGLATAACGAIGGSLSVFVDDEGALRFREPSSAARRLTAGKTNAA